MINGICRRLCFNDNDDEIFRGTCSASSKAAAEYCDHQYVGLSVVNISPKIACPNFTEFSTHVACGRGSVTAGGVLPVLWIMSHFL